MARYVKAPIADVVLERDGGRCTACGERIVGDRNRSWKTWMRLPRPAAGEPIDLRVTEPSNLVAVCGADRSCHRAIRSHPEAARRRGLILRPGEDPRFIPVLAWTGERRGAVQLMTHVTPFLLADDGTRTEVAEDPGTGAVPAVDRDALAEDTLRRYCLPLVAKVRDEDPEAYAAWIAAIPVDRLRVAAVLLAALVPEDRPVSELAAWARYRALFAAADERRAAA